MARTRAAYSTTHPNIAGTFHTSVWRRHPTVDGRSLGTHQVESVVCRRRTSARLAGAYHVVKVTLLVALGRYECWCERVKRLRAEGRL